MESQILEVSRANGGRLNQLFVAGKLKRSKHCPLLKWKIELILVYHLEQDNFLLIASEQRQRFYDRFRIAERIGYHDDQTATLATMQKRIRRLSPIRFTARSGLSQKLHDIVKMARLILRRKIEPDGRVKGRYSDSILLCYEQVGHASSEPDRVLVFGQTVCSPARVLHRTALIEQECAPKIGLVFVLPNVEPIGLAEEFPIDRSDLIPCNVGPMFFEIDAGSRMSRSMDTSTHSLYHLPGQQL
jgi:hypothetical protein